jgi:hypothetical protein
MSRLAFHSGDAVVTGFTRESINTRESFKSRFTLRTTLSRRTLGTVGSAESRVALFTRNTFRPVDSLFSGNTALSWSSLWTLDLAEFSTLNIDLEFDQSLLKSFDQVGLALQLGQLLEQLFEFGGGRRTEGFRVSVMNGDRGRWVDVWR